MSEGSTIGVKKSDGTIHSIYCSHNSGIDNAGKILLSNYNSEYFVEKLINLGDVLNMENLFKNIKRNYDNSRTNGIKREPWDEVKPHIHQNLNEYMEWSEYYNAEYIYLFDDQQWMVSEFNNLNFEDQQMKFTRFIPVKTAIELLDAKKEIIDKINRDIERDF